MRRSENRMREGQEDLNCIKRKSGWFSYF